MEGLLGWVQETFTKDAFWPWVILAIPLWAIAIYIRLYKTEKGPSLGIIKLKEKYLSLQQRTPRSQEKNLPICELYVYPVRGIRAGAQVDEIDLGMHGVKYDREILLASKGDHAIVTSNKFHPMCCLRQVLEGSIVTISTEEPERLKEKNLPLTLSINLDDDPEKTGPFVECQKGYFGFQFDDKVAEWFSTAIGKDVIAIRSPLRRRTRLNPKRLIFDRHDDLRKTFCTDAAFHVINKASVEELAQRVKDRHPEGLPNFFVSSEQFRPNVVIDWPESFAEDRWFELRAGPILMRNSGPCIRCNTIRLNLDKSCRVEEMEPYSTLSVFRNVPGLGPLFGMYYQMDVLETKEMYYSCLPPKLGYPAMTTALKQNPISLRPLEEQHYVKIRKTDGLTLRCEKEMDWAKKFKPAEPKSK